ncbi:MAG: OmpA family protein [Actinomycetota bacterium]
METMRRDPIGDDDDDKLIPEWGARADDQIIWAGLAVFAAVFLLAFGWDRWFGGDDASVDTDDAVTAVVDDVTGAATGGDLDLGDGATAGAIAAPALVEQTTTTTEATTTTTEATTTSTTEAPTTTVAAGPAVGNVQAAVDPLPGAIVAGLDGADVTLAGFVADSAEEAAAIDAAAAVDGVESVTSELVLLEPAVAEVLADQGVVVATVDGVGTEIAVAGTLQSEADRASTIAAAGDVDGVTAIIDQLDVSVADALNQLPTIPFRTASAEILTDGRTIVAEAAALIAEAGPDATFEVQGYTDVRGDDARNLTLSRERAAAVVDALVAAGVDAGSLTAEGFGETEQFGEGDSPEALAANRVVRFVQIG